MKKTELKAIVVKGEDSRLQFKRDIRNVDALVHRDYLVSAPIRLFVFDNRVDIVSPGHLPDSLTVEKIRTGNSIIRNPILVSYTSRKDCCLTGESAPGSNAHWRPGRRSILSMTVMAACSQQQFIERL